MLSIEKLYELYIQHPSVVTDTRKVKTGDLFFALKGPNFNGNKFAAAALESGAAYSIVDDASYVTDPRILLTDDVLNTLQQLALFHRQQFNIPVIAITGSNGKTTTKEQVHAVLSSAFKTYTTQGNLNNHIGVPLTLLSIKADAEMAIIEMGANHQLEIASYCSFTKPNFGLITNCGKAHLEGFGGIEGVRKGKGELFDFLKANSGKAFACSDFDYFKTMTAGLSEVHWYGTTDGELVGTVLQSEPFLTVAIKKGLSHALHIHTQLVGAYNIYNVLAAISIGKYFGVPEEKMIAAIETYTPTNSRSQLIEKDGNHIILDAYNANPSSMAAAIENFAKLQASSKILFLGAMMELGNESLQEHENLIALLQKFNWQEVVLVGGDFGKIKHPYRYFSNAQEAGEWWKANATANNYLLVKGSRSMQMEKLLEA